MSKLTNDSDVTEMFGNVIGMAVLGLHTDWWACRYSVCNLRIIGCYIWCYGVAMIRYILLAGIVCMCVSGIKKKLTGPLVQQRLSLVVLSCLLLLVGHWPLLVI